MYNYTNNSVFSHFFDSLSSQMESLYSELYNDMHESFLALPHAVDIGSSNYPKCDIFDSEDRLKICLAVPGISKQDLKVKLKNNDESTIAMLNISADKQNKEDSSGSYKSRIVKQIHTSSFSKTFKVNKKICDVTTLSTDLKDGLLTITLLKVKPQSEQKPKAEWQEITID